MRAISSGVRNCPEWRIISFRSCKKKKIGYLKKSARKSGWKMKGKRLMAVAAVRNQSKIKLKKKVVGNLRRVQRQNRSVVKKENLKGSRNAKNLRNPRKKKNQPRKNFQMSSVSATDDQQRKFPSLKNSRKS